MSVKKDLTKVASIFASPEEYDGKTVTVGGWIRNSRFSNAFGFIELNDGSCFKNLQIVLSAQELPNYSFITKQNVGACFIVSGTVVLTPGAKQPLELRASEVVLEGASDPSYPLQKKRHSVEFLRQQAYLRPRTNLFSAVFRVRSVAAHAIHTFFQERGSSLPIRKRLFSCRRAFRHRQTRLTLLSFA